MVFGAIRLARFNVTTSQNEPNVFIGLPIPAAAVFVVSWLLLEMGYFQKYFENPKIISPFLLIASLIVALLMVSNIRYPSFKKLNFEKISFGKIIVFLMIILAILFAYPILSITILITCYVLFGPSRALYYLTKHFMEKRK